MTLPMNPCGNRTRHTSRIGCCATCKRMFSSDGAFEKHRTLTGCVDPEEVGLVAHPSRSAPGEFLWSLPGNGRDWGKLRSEASKEADPTKDTQTASSSIPAGTASTISGGSGCYVV